MLQVQTRLKKDKFIANTAGIFIHIDGASGGGLFILWIINRDGYNRI